MCRTPASTLLVAALGLLAMYSVVAPVASNLSSSARCPGAHVWTAPPDAP